MPLDDRHGNEYEKEFVVSSDYSGKITCEFSRNGARWKFRWVWTSKKTKKCQKHAGNHFIMAFSVNYFMKL